MAGPLQSGAPGASLGDSTTHGDRCADAVGTGCLVAEDPLSRARVVEEPQRRGFTYGTLPGHPEAGEERFLLEHLNDGRILFTITAFSRPASTLAKLGGPISRVTQTFMTQRYLHALDRL